MVFEIFRSEKNDKFYFRLKNNEGDIVLASQGYASKATCKNGIESIKKNAQVEKYFEQKISDNGKFYFTLKARNGQVIGTSQMFTTEAAKKAELMIVRKAVDAEIIDHSK